MDRADMVANADRPVVQDSECDDHVELILPQSDIVVQLHHDVFLSLFADGMRIITGTPVDDLR